MGKKLKALVIYWSATGNTEKVANAIQRGLSSEGIDSVLKRVEEAEEEELYDYDLVFLGSPVIRQLPPEKVMRFVRNKSRIHRERGDIKVCAPKIQGKTAIVFCTYAGPHTGIREAVPAGKYLGQFFEHLGFNVKDEWYIIGEFHGREDLSTQGKLGDIRGRPSAEDLSEIERRVSELINSVES